VPPFRVLQRGVAHVAARQRLAARPSPALVHRLDHTMCVSVRLVECLEPLVCTGYQKALSVVIEASDRCLVSRIVSYWVGRPVRVRRAAAGAQTRMNENFTSERLRGQNI
jgi:hypothetical protein